MPRLLALAGALLAVTGCGSGAPEPGVATATATLAAPAGAVSYYAFRSSGEGTATTVQARAVGRDSAETLAWDLGLRGVEVVLNGGASGPGAGIGVVTDAPFGAVTDARLGATPYRRDGESPCPTGPPRAVCTGPGDGWYALGAAGDVVPVPGRTLVLRLGDNRGYAKVEFLDYDGDVAGGTYDLRFTTNPQGPSFVVSDGD